MDRSSLINIVKLKMDEFTPEGVGLPFDEYIGPLLDESAREILAKGPLHMLTPTAIPQASAAYANDKSYLPVPADYIRLYEIKYPLWKKSVRVAMSAENPEYKIQENEYIRSGYGRPTVTVVYTSVGGGAVTRYLECSKVVTPVTGTVIALYVKDAKPEDIADLFTDALTWLTTAKVLAIMGNPERAKVPMEQYASALSAWLI